jgi:hypothetical protein
VEELLADAAEHVGVLGLAVAQVRAGHGAMDSVADDGGSRVEQHSLAMVSGSDVEESVRRGEVGRFEDAVGLTKQQIQPARVAGARQPYDGPGAGPLTRDESVTGSADQAHSANVRNVGRGERNQQPER